MPCRSGSLAVAALWASGCFHLTYDHPACGRDGACPDGLRWNSDAAARRIALTNPDSSAADFGVTVASAGDVNGDGYSDFVVGADNAIATIGTAHVFLGTSAPRATTWSGSGARRIDLTSPDLENAFFGTSVAQLSPTPGCSGSADVARSVAVRERSRRSSSNEGGSQWCREYGAWQRPSRPPR